MLISWLIESQNAKQFGFPHTIFIFKWLYTGISNGFNYIWIAFLKIGMIFVEMEMVVIYKFEL